MSTLLHDEIVEIIGAIILILSLIVVYLIHRSKDNNINFLDLFIDPKTGRIGGSEARINFAFLLSSWCLIFLAMKSELSEWFYGAYVGAFVLDRALSRIGSLTGGSTDGKTTTTTPAVKPGVKPDDDDNG